MLAKKLGTVHRIEVEVSGEEMQNLLDLCGTQGVPPDIVDFIKTLFVPPRPVCYGKKAELDMRTEPCATQCALSKDCAIHAATGPLEQPTG